VYPLKKYLLSNEKKKNISSTSTDDDTAWNTQSSVLYCKEPQSSLAIYKMKCFICGQIKTKGDCVKFRICETGRARAFLEATTFFQDVVFTRTCGL
jgi:hypothetical protein